MPKVGQMSRVMVLAGFLWMATTVVGQDQPAPKAANPKAKSAPTSPEAKEFQELLAVREQLGLKLEKLQGPLQAANEAKDVKKFQQLAQEFNGLISDFEANTLPRLLALAGPLYLKDANNAEAEGIVLGYLEDLCVQNKFKQVITEGNKYLAAGRVKPLILNVMGVSYFATQDFARAEEFLSRAKAEGDKDENAGILFAKFGAPYLPQCRPYEALWKKEQAIRAKEAAATGEARLPRVLLKTNKGDIELELFENEAPNTVANFVSLVEKKKYDGIAFHRVLANFMAQGGDPNTLDKDTSNDGLGGPGYHIPCECFQPNARMHFQGSLSMAHAGRDSGGSQFFLTHLPTPHLNPHVDPKDGEEKGHTVFGRIVKGLDVALAIRPGDRIITATVLFKRNHPYVPKTIPE